MLQRGRPKNNISHRCVDRVLRPHPRLSLLTPLFLSLSFALLYHLKQQRAAPWRPFAPRVKFNRKFVSRWASPSLCLPCVFSRITNVIAPGAGWETAERWEWKDGSWGAKRGRWRMRRDMVSLNTAYVSLSLSFSICGGREEGKDGLRRKDEVCNWCNICGLQGGINVCSLRALSPSSLFPLLRSAPRSRQDSPRKSPFSLIALFLFLFSLS